MGRVGIEQWKRDADGVIGNETSLPNKKLIHRKQIAHQLRTQYVDGIYSIFVTLKSRLRVTQDH